MAASPSRDQRPVFSLVEEATHLLRRTPASAWLICYLGGAPFVLYLFFFWSDMSRSGMASHRLLESSLILALLYWAMKVGQALFCDHLMRLVQGREEAPEKMPFRGWLRLLTSQAWIHATMPWVMTLASAAVIPVAWVYAFYHNVTAMAVDHFRQGGRTHALSNKALTQSHHMPLQNHGVMVVITVTGILVYLNLFVLFIMATLLAKSFTGIENTFSMHPTLYISSSLQAVIIAASYLVMNPLVKALYVLRCFYGMARKNGADLEVRLRRVQNKNITALVTGLVMFLCVIPSTRAEIAETPQTAELDHSIQEVLRGSEYQWRLPRDAGAEPPDDSWLGTLIRDVTKWFEDSVAAFGRFLGDLKDWLFGGREGAVQENTGTDNSQWLAIMPKLLIVLMIVLALAMVWLLYRNWKQARATVPLEAPATTPEINLESETVVATQLPEDEWLRLAREKIASGELRLALRALFLATLAHLGEKGLLRISRSKSNGDYARELHWRARDRSALSDGFSEQVRTFDRVWYGWHEVNPALMESFEQQHHRITSHAS